MARPLRIDYGAFYHVISKMKSKDSNFPRLISGAQAYGAFQAAIESLWRKRNRGGPAGRLDYKF
jgi:hypothetical protein